MSERPYCRVYWSIRSDPKFATIYGDDANLATWLRLLIAADAMWPEPADIPGTCRRKAYQALVAAGLIDDLGRGQFRIHGLDAERSVRSEQAHRASSARWNARSNAPSNADSNARAFGQGMPLRAEPSKAEPSPVAPAREGTDDDPAGAYWSLVGKYPAGKVLTWIDDLAGRYGGPAVIRAMAEAHMADRATATLLGRTSDLLAAGARQLERAEREDEKRRLREKRAVPPALPVWDDAERQAIWARHRDEIAKAAGRTTA